MICTPFESGWVDWVPAVVIVTRSSSADVVIADCADCTFDAIWFVDVIRTKFLCTANCVAISCDRYQFFASFKLEKLPDSIYATIE